MTVDLQFALAFVEGVLKEAEAELGPAPGFADSAYFSRRKVVMDRCARVLTERLGARINDRWDVASVKMAGVRATCTAGLPGALQNWMTAARRRLEA